MRSFGELLKEARREFGMSQRDVAKDSGINYIQIGCYERGAYLPTLPNAFRLAKLMGISLDELAQQAAIPADAHGA